MRICLGLLLVLIPTMLAEDGGRAEYMGGTVSDFPGKTDLRIHTTDDTELVLTGRKAGVRIPYDKVNLLEYGQKVDRRYAMAIIISPVLLLSKKRQHFLTVGYTDSEGRQQAMVFRIAKGDVRSVLASLEARTGRKVQYQDDEARKAGKG